jgi:STE24 endopeptidase
MNESKSSRYHRAKRRAGLVQLAWGSALLGAMLWMRPSLSLSVYVLLLAVVHEVVALPLVFYTSFVLERRYELSTEPFGTWIKDHLKAFAIATSFGLAAAHGVYALIRWMPVWWWLAAAVAGTGITILLARLAPVVLLPLFYRFVPLERPALNERLVALSGRAGVPVLGVYEWALGAKTRRANAALVGAGATRRILLSDTLLADYSEDEIEVILAHELGHHVHHDIPKGLAMEFAVLLAAFYGAAGALRTFGAPLGLGGPGDVAGLPVVLLALGAVSLAATPLLYALSRTNERRADRFALSLTRRPDAFITAMRRLGSQNLSEENPSRATVWMFHTHPPMEERIVAARTPQ